MFLEGGRVQTGRSEAFIYMVRTHFSQQQGFFWRNTFITDDNKQTSFCCCSAAKSSPTLCDPGTAACQAPPSSTVSRSLLIFMSIELVMPSNHLILCHPLLLLHSIFPSIRVFSNEPALRIEWPKYQSISISPSNECSGLVSFRIDWLNLLVVQRTPKSFLQPHNLKASVLQ